MRSNISVSTASKLNNQMLGLYDIDVSNGFLPSKEPLTALPDEFEIWDSMAQEFSGLLNAGVFRTQAEAMPIINDVSRLQTPMELERAMLLLSIFGHGFVWQGYESSGYVPASIAIPWTLVAERLGRPPTLAHASLVLNNWKKLRYDDSIKLGNLRTLIQFHGGLDESWFYLVTTEIEAIGAGVLNQFSRIQQVAHSDDFQQIEDSLKEVCDSLTKLNMTLNRMYENCDPYIFYNRIRPFLASFEKIEYRGCKQNPRSYFGGSAAQSSLLQAIDAMLGIKHREEKSRSYLVAMRNYMPTGHAAYINALENEKPLVRAIARHNGCQQIHTACVDALTKFRQSHLKIVSDYVSSQMSNIGPGHTGTGGTDPIVFLKQIAKDTTPSF
ncbi:MAG: hypothetical protein VX275_08405 [Pseudomonadota bacterium]|nr:hypothetical protein [Pseudomonadota bacterium]